MLTMRFRTTAAMLATASALLLLLAGCSTGMNGKMGGGYDLTFQGDGSFNKPHGGQGIMVAVVDAASGNVVAKQKGTVSASANPAFSFAFDGVLAGGKSYEVHYWIDSNFGGGRQGSCDPKNNDHQWNVSLGSVSGDVQHTEPHQPPRMTSVCQSFKTM